MIEVKQLRHQTLNPAAVCLNQCHGLHHWLCQIANVAYHFKSTLMMFAEMTNSLLAWLQCECCCHGIIAKRQPQLMLID